MKVKRSSAIVFITMLLLHTVFTHVGVTYQVYAEGSESPVLLDGQFIDEEKEGSDGIRIVQFQWILNEQVDSDTVYERKIPEGSTVTEAQTGELLYEGAPIGDYELSEDGNVSVQFDEGVEALPDATTGTFEVEVVVEEQEEAIDDSKASPTADGDEESGQIIENIIDDLRLIRENGFEYEEGDFLDLDEDLRLELDWSLPNGHNYQAGDTFTFYLPEVLTIYNELDGDLDGYGTYYVTADGEVTFTFSEKIENESDINGTFWVETVLDEQVVTEVTEEIEIIFNDEVVERISINVKPKGGQAIHKNGQPVNGHFNTEEIAWTVIINTTRESLENAVVHDPVLDGQQLILDSIDVKEVEVNLEGHVVEVLDVDVDYTDASTEAELRIELGNTTKAYQLTFRTKMKETEKDKEGWMGYENTAYLNSDGKEQAQSGASVSVQRPESLVKTSSVFDEEERSIEWEVKANFTEKELAAGTVIVDEFTFTIGDEEVNDVFEITLDAIDIQQVDSFGDNGAVGETSNAKDLFDISIEGNKVTYTLKEASNKAFIITYKTTAKEGAYINDDGTISNTVGIDGKTDTSSQGVYQQVGVKTHSGINYEDKTIDWTITVNADSQQLNNFILTDDFSSSGQKLVEGSIEVDPEISDDAIIPNEDGEGFVIHFGNINEPYTITYQTEFTYDFGDTDDKPSFKNGVHVSYTTSDGDDYELEFGDNVDPNRETRNNGAKNSSVNNETKEITWMVDINYNQLELDDAKLIDVIADNQSFVDGSVAIYPTTIEEDGTIIVGENAVLDFDVEATENEINIDFGAIDQSYRIVFMTVDKDGVYNSDEVYENTAQFIPREGEVHHLTAHATLPNQGEFLGKDGEHNKETWTIDWELTINESKSTLTNVTVTDDLGDESLQILLEDSIQITKLASAEQLVAGEDYEINVSGNEFSVTFIGEITDTYVITYSSYILASETVDISNEAKVTSTEEIVGYVESEETIHVKISTGGGTGEGTTGELFLEKVESDTNRPLENVAFTLSKTIGEQEIVVREGTTDEAGTIHWTGLQFGDYTLEEVIPEGYLGEETQLITVSSDAPEGIQTITIENARETGRAFIKKVDAATGEKLNGAVFEITNLITDQTYTLTTEEDGTVSEEVPFGEYTVEEITAPNGYRVTEDIENITIEIGETTMIEVVNEAIVDVSGKKTWFTDENIAELDAITVELFAHGEKIDERIASADTNWEYSFTNLDKYDANGEEIEYSIKEVEVDGYLSEGNGFDLINIQTVDLSGEKNWVEVDDQYRPDSITVHLLADGVKVASKEVTAGDEGIWLFTFTDAPKFDAEGNIIDYTIEEENVPGYISEIEDYTITNNQETTEFSGTKTWLDDDSEDRPTVITVQLKNGNTIVQETEVTAADGWNYTFKDIPKYDKEGNEIVYTVDELAVEGYEKSIDGHDITNVRVGTTEVDVTKFWQDEHENDRPDKLTINLLQNGVPYGEYEVTAENNWELTITDLPQYDENGVTYEYTINEHDVPGYDAAIDGHDITNTRADVKTIEINKSWLDDDSEDRPDTIEVELFRSVSNGDLELVDTYTITAADEWSLEIIDLPAFDKHGKAYTYEIAEKAIEGYETTVNGFDLTNLRVGETEVTGTKTWIEVDDQYRADSITVTLLANGEFEDSIEVAAADDWSYAFTNLAKYDATGAEIIYTVVEDDVPGYVSEVDGFDITNTQESTEITGTKTWKDDDGENRPDSITVQLMNGDTVVDEQEVTAEDDWLFTFTNVAKYDSEGNEIMYTINELPVPGYTTEIDGFDITNTRAEVIDVAGTKTWKNDKEADRPDSITIQLLANGEVIDSLEVTAETDWTYVFESLPGYDESGVSIVYSVDEVNVKGYEPSINGYDITNTLIPVDEDKSEVPEDPTDKDQGGTLPKTATNIFNMIGIGLGLFILGLAIMAYRRKRQMN